MRDRKRRNKGRAQGMEETQERIKKRSEEGQNKSKADKGTQQCRELCNNVRRSPRCVGLENRRGTYDAQGWNNNTET